MGELLILPPSKIQQKRSSIMITITPLSGPFPSPPSYLLVVDSAKILLDCGSFDNSPEYASSSTSSALQASDYLQTLRELAPTLNLVLLSHPLLNSLGLLPWLKAKCGLRCPVYATLPTREMGRWAVEEWVEARTAEQKNESRKVATKENGSVGAAVKKRRGKERASLLDENKMIAAVVKDEADGDEEMKLATDEDPWDAVWKVTLKEVRDAFLAVKAVRWTQPVHLSGPLKGYTLVAHRSGHTLGGALWTLRPSLSSSLSPASSSSSLLYAPIFNHIKEHHLNGAALLNGAKIDDSMRRMGVVIVGGDRSQVVNVKRVDREKGLLSEFEAKIIVVASSDHEHHVSLDLVNFTLESGGSILMPTDPSARLLELLVLLESHWNFSNLGQRFPLVLISRTGRDVVGFVRSLTEWMGGQVGSGEDGSQVLQFQNLRIYPSIEELNQSIPSNVPKLILTVPATLSHGFSRKLFVNMAQNPSNLVILTGKGEEGTFARWLWGVWNEKQAPGSKWGAGNAGKPVELSQTVSMVMKSKVFLEGEELAQHEEKERNAADREAKHQALLERSRRMMQADADSSDSDSDESVSEEEEAVDITESGGIVRKRVGGFTGGAGAWDEFLDPLSVEGKAGGQSFDVYVKGSFAKRAVTDGREGLPRYRMFPVVERKRRVDAYGEAIDVDGWLKRGLEDDPFKANLNSLQVAAAKRAREEETVEEAKPEPPHKYLVEMMETHLMCSLYVVDMEGRADGRALKTILPQINPRKLVIVDGPPSSIADLVSACKAVGSMTQDIYTPDVGQCVAVGEETKNFSVRLGDSVMASLKLSRVEDYDVAFVNGTIHFNAESGLPVLERTSLADAAATPSLLSQQAASDDFAMEITSPETTIALYKPPKSNSDVLPPLVPALVIGDLRLTMLKDKLDAINVPSEFAGEGVLLCGPAPPNAFDLQLQKHLEDDSHQSTAGKSVNDVAAEYPTGKVAVKKSGRGRLMIEGTVGETYYVVRRTIYSVMAMAS